MTDILSASLCKSNDMEPDTLLGHAEAVILEAIIKNPELVIEHQVEAKHFDSPILNVLCGIILSIKRDGLIVSDDLVVARLREGDCFDEITIQTYRTMEGWGGVSPNLGYYVKLLKERQFSRECDETLLRSQLVEEAPAQKATNLIESMGDLIAKYSPPRIAGFDLDWQQVCQVSIDAANGIFPFSLKTHFPKLDRLLGEGILEDYLFVLGADPGAGKTTFALSLAKNIAMYNQHSTAYFSFEMGRTRLMRWYMSACTAIPFANFMDGTLNDADIESLESVRKTLPKNALDIIECLPDVETVIQEIRLHIKKNPGCKLIVIDHLHRLGWKKSSNAVEVQSAVTGALKDIVLEMKVPILLLAHLVKAGKEDKVEAPRPELIKGSGTVIADADIVVIARMAPPAQQTPRNRVVNMYVVKNRGGRAEGAYSQIANIPGTAVMTDHENVVQFMS